MCEQHLPVAVEKVSRAELAEFAGEIGDDAKTDLQIRNRVTIIPRGLILCSNAQKSNFRVGIAEDYDFEFGVGVEDVSDSSGLFDTTGIEGFTSWFITPNVRLSARYRVADVDYFGNILIPSASRVSDADQNSYGISATVRF